MRRRLSHALLWPAMASLVLAAAPAHALIMVSDGNKPVKNHGWPLDCEKVANVSCRLGYMEGPPFGGGQYIFYFKCKNPAEFDSAVMALAGIRAPRVEIVVHDGPGPEYTFGPERDKAKRPRVDWVFTVWKPDNWHRLFNNPRGTFFSAHPNWRKPVPPPRIDVYVGDGGVVWDAARVPEHVHVVDKRAAAAPVQPVGGGLVAGDIYDMATGQPVADAEVTIVRRKGREASEVVASGVTDAMGSIEIGKIPEGRFEIRLRAKGYASRGLAQYTNKGNTYHEFLAELMREGQIAGRVAGVDGKPIAGARITARNSLAIDGRGYNSIDAKPAETDADGRFELRGLPAGYAGVRCRVEGMYPTTPIFELHDVPAKDVAIVMVGTGIIRGTVAGKGKREPHVHLEAAGGAKRGTWGGSMRCKPDGGFEFKGVPPGDYVLSTRPLHDVKRNAPGVVAITVTAGKTIEVKLTR